MGFPPPPRRPTTPSNTPTDTQFATGAFWGIEDGMNMMAFETTTRPTEESSMTMTNSAETEMQLDTASSSSTTASNEDMKDSKSWALVKAFSSKPPTIPPAVFYNHPSSPPSTSRLTFRQGVVSLFSKTPSASSTSGAGGGGELPVDFPHPRRWRGPRHSTLGMGRSEASTRLLVGGGDREYVSPFGGSVGALSGRRIGRGGGNGKEEGEVRYVLGMPVSIRSHFRRGHNCVDTVLERANISTLSLEEEKQMEIEKFYEAIRTNDVCVVKRMLEDGFDVDTKDDKGRTALHIACTSALCQPVSTSFSPSSMPSFTPSSSSVTTTRPQSTLSTFAPALGHRPYSTSSLGTLFTLPTSTFTSTPPPPTSHPQDSILPLLLSATKNPNIQDSNSNTPLHLSLLSHNLHSARLLLSSGADPTIKDSNGRDCLDLVKSRLERVQTEARVGVGARGVIVGELIGVLSVLRAYGVSKERQRQVKMEMDEVGELDRLSWALMKMSTDEPLQGTLVSLSELKFGGGDSEAGLRGFGSSEGKEKPTDRREMIKQVEQLVEMLSHNSIT
ncbi:hypothetical protein HDV05_006640 [Chytridiales sp. JEL 0842]|nr:hypothetical protein HDV05_006640 [Chytridiales sp. JEL 0842]